MRNQRVIVMWGKCHSLEVDTAQNECACSAVLWFESESITNAPLQSPNSHLLPQYIFLLNKICDWGSSKEPFLKAATLSILIWAYPRETKTNNGNFKNAAILPSKVAYRWQACVLILPLCPRSVVNFHACAVNELSYCRKLSNVAVLSWLALASLLF